jgi:hypothetical protein
MKDKKPIEISKVLVHKKYAADLIKKTEHRHGFQRPFSGH